LALGALLSLATAAAAQSDPPWIKVLPPGGAGPGKPVGRTKGSTTSRDADRAAALARGRERFFNQQSGFDHPTDDPLATGGLPAGTGVLPATILPNVKKR
jgi:hypothetical protein